MAGAESEAVARRDIVTVCRRLYDRGLIAGQDGNVSVRLTPDRILVTPAGMSKVDVTEESLVTMMLDGTRCGGEGEPSSEVEMHLHLYRRRDAVGAVVHAHPPTAIAFSVVGETLDPDVLPEVIYQLGAVPLVPYATPGTPALARSLDPYLAGHDAFLLAHHGATTVGPTLTIAHQRMESLEHAARILLSARALGPVNTLTPSQVDVLLQARRAGQRAT